MNSMKPYLFLDFDDVLGTPHWTQRGAGNDWDRIVLDQAGFTDFTTN
jgi:hypothetical protein